MFFDFLILPKDSNENGRHTEANLYIAPEADPVLKITKSLQNRKMYTLDAATTRNLCVFHGIGARFQIRNYDFATAGVKFASDTANKWKQTFARESYVDLLENIILKHWK